MRRSNRNFGKGLKLKKLANVFKFGRHIFQKCPKLQHEKLSGENSFENFSFGLQAMLNLLNHETSFAFHLVTVSLKLSKSICD